MENPNFLKKFKGLGADAEVLGAKKRTEQRTGKRVKGDFASLIQNYLNRFAEFKDHINEARDGRPKERAIERAKVILMDVFLTTYEDIPESYWLGSFMKEISEKGISGDWKSMSDEERERYKIEYTHPLLEDQKASLEEWLDYFMEKDSDDIPDYLKYWAFRSVTGLQEYEKPKDWSKENEKKGEMQPNKEEGKFPRRSKNTLKKFPDLHHEALRYVVDAVMKKYQGGTMDFEYDIQPEDREQFQQYLKQENFAKLYAWAMELINPIPEHLLPITEGEWRKYPQGSDVASVTQTLRGQGTGLCIAGKGAANNYLTSGDLHIFYSNDEEGKPAFPRIAIHGKGEQIAEMRGIAYKQNLDPYITDVAKEKLSEFSNGEQYTKQTADMRHLTAIEHKTKEGQVLTKDDLTFLYELDSTIEGFGYQKDPRIKEIRNQRNPEEDMLVIFECTKDQIAHTPNDITKNTKAYVGPLESGIFQKLPESIEHIYTTFPERRIKREHLTIGGKTGEQLLKELQAANINIYDYAKSMLKSPEFVAGKTAEEITLIRLTVADLGFTGSKTTDQLYKRAKELGLELCPPDTGPHYRLHYQNQPLGEWVRIGMKSITDSDGDPNVFYVACSYGGLWLCGRWSFPDDEWRPRNEFVFRSRPPEAGRQV